MEKKSGIKNQSVEKMLKIVEAMADCRGTVRLNDLSASVGMPDSTVMRMLVTLIELDYAYQDKTTSQYGLTLKFMNIGQKIQSGLSIPEIARPLLEELSEITGESACLAQEFDMELVYLDVVEGTDNVLRVTQRIGKRAPLHTTGIGKLILTQYSDEKLQKLVETKGLPVFTEHTKGTLEKLKIELEKIKKQGFALDDEECEIGVRCIAAPVRRYDGKIVAGISISGSTARLTYENMETLTPVVCDVARQLSARLAYKKD